MAHQNKSSAYQRGQNVASAFGSARRYSVLVIILEVLLRTELGSRYLNGRSFFGGLVGLVVLRFFEAMNPATYTINETVFGALFFFDGFIILYVVMSFWHFWLQWRHRFIYDDELSESSYYLGHSRLAFIGKLFSSRYYAEITYYFVEPLTVLLLAIPIASHSFFLGVVTALAALRLWWENAKAMNEERQRKLDRIDNLKYGRYVQQTSPYYQPLRTGKTAYPHRAKRVKKSSWFGFLRPKKTHKRPKSSGEESPSPKLKDMGKPNAVEKALNNLDPDLRDLGSEE